MTGRRTDSIHGHGYFDEGTGSFKVPLHLSAAFEHPDRRTGEARKSDRGFEQKYSREENPTVRALERVVAKLEGASESLAFNSGMAAVATTLVSSLGQGDSLVVTKESYGTTQELALDLSRFGVKTTLVGPETGDIVEGIRQGTALVFAETITNPLLRVVDLGEIRKRCAEVGARLVVDNTFATPLLYRPVEEGAWLAIESSTKYIAGHNDVVGGVAALDDQVDLTELWNTRRRLGTIAGPFDAFLALRGVSTLDVRFRAECESAQAIAEYLEDNPGVESVSYPGLEGSPYRRVADRQFKGQGHGGVVSFKVKGGKAAALEVLRKVRVVKPSPSLGGTESLLSAPVTSASKTMSPAVREELGITPNLLRLSVGLEDVEDLEADLSQSLAHSGG